MSLPEELRSGQSHTKQSVHKWYKKIVSQKHSKCFPKDEDVVGNPH
jgi:hypothetical protein